MSKIVVPLLAVFCLGAQAYFGFVGAGLSAPLAWSFGTAMFAVGTGWRAGDKDITLSVLVGTSYAAATYVPIYLVGRWFGDPTSSSRAFTAIASILGLMTFGSLALLRPLRRRVQKPIQPAHDNKQQVKLQSSPVVEDAFKKVHRLMENERAQNERLSEPLRSKVLGGADCDEISAAVGEFGRDPRNPIPVNGPLGEMVYLSNLRTDTLKQIIFHRLGSLSDVDIYETASLDGAKWDILFLHPYHPRKSRRAPSGYQMMMGQKSGRILLGCNDFVAAFPTGLADAIAKESERAFGFRMRPRQIRDALAETIFKRPIDHLKRLRIIVDALKERA